MSKLSVSCRTMQKSKQKKSCTKTLQAEVPCAKNPCAKELHINKKPLIVSLSSLFDNFFAKEALLASCMLENNSEIKATVLLDTKATKYSFVNPATHQIVKAKNYLWL